MALNTNDNRSGFAWTESIGRAARSPAFTKVALDLLVWTLVTPLAFLVRFDVRIPMDLIPAVAVMTAVMVGIKLGAATIVRLHRKSWHRVAFREVFVLGVGALAIGFGTTITLVALYPFTQIPPSIGILDGVFTLLGMAGIRSLTRMRHESNMASKATVDGPRKRVLVIGAGEGGSLVVREMLRHPETGMKPIGFLDDDPAKAKQTITTVPVLGKLDDLEAVLTNFDVDEVLIAIPSADGTVIRSIVERISRSKSTAKYRTIPGVYELLSGRVSINRIREVEIEDLLRREPVELDSSTILGYIEGKRVMVTGAGGSIGSELVRQICRFHPKELILFGHGENSIYTLERELDRDWPHIRYKSVIGAIQNGPRLDFVFRRYRPDVIFHTAAHKHVPLMELNPEEAIFNNVIGSKNLVDLSLLYGISHFVNISTDKAVNPTSIMGASKRVVEQVVQCASRRAAKDQVFVSVRFGNVLGSRGSVIPLFKDQIRDGGPVTVTHPEMVRFFMTIPEAAQLVLQASGQGRNGEIYILDMGKPVKILDLAKDLIALSGFEPNVDIKIEYTGIRPGEKLYEEVMTDDERSSVTSHDQIHVARSVEVNERALDRVLGELHEAALESDHARIRNILGSFVDGCNLEDMRHSEAMGAALRD